MKFIISFPVAFMGRLDGRENHRWFFANSHSLVTEWPHFRNRWSMVSISFLHNGQRGSSTTSLPAKFPLNGNLLRDNCQRNTCNMLYGSPIIPNSAKCSNESFRSRLYHRVLSIRATLIIKRVLNISPVYLLYMCRWCCVNEDLFKKCLIVNQKKV